MTSTSTNLVRLMAEAADLLERAGNLDQPLNVAINLQLAAMPDIQVTGPFGAPIAKVRSAFDHLGDILGAKGELKPVADGTYCYQAYTALPSGSTVGLLVLTPHPDLPTAPPAPRTTTTARTAALLRALAPWASGLPTSEICTLRLADHGTDHSVEITIGGTGANHVRRTAAEAVAAGLPARLEHRRFGSRGDGILPTGHLLRITTL
ncbi:hypothetical protein GCM10010519_18460 [Streptomyces lactacystinicus]|uniref:hypothetical protein n=1 Tax=unclassified Kitasatospora TaxID=2633591 RepID=UPI00336C4947